MQVMLEFTYLCPSQIIKDVSCIGTLKLFRMQVFVTTLAIA